jgi:hypothetical protein
MLTPPLRCRLRQRHAAMPFTLFAESADADGFACRDFAMLTLSDYFRDIFIYFTDFRRRRFAIAISFFAGCHDDAILLEFYTPWFAYLTRHAERRRFILPCRHADAAAGRDFTP